MRKYTFIKQQQQQQQQQQGLAVSNSDSVNTDKWFISDK